MTNNNHRLIYPKLLNLLIMLTITSSQCAFANVSSSDANKHRLSHARAELAQGNLQTAKGILLDLLQTQPHMLRAKADLAVTYYRLQEWQNANKIVTQLLASNKLPKTVSLNIARLQQKIAQHIANAKVSQPHKLFGFVQVSMGNDSNLALTSINDVFSDNVFDPNVATDMDVFDHYEYPIDYDDNYYDQEPYQIYSIDDICLTEPGPLSNCQQLQQIISDFGLQASTYLSDGFIDQNGDFVPYSDLLPIDETVTDVIEQPISYNYNDAFWQVNAKVSHQYLNKANKWQWTNTLNMTSATAFELSEFDKSRVRYNTRLLKSVNHNWLLSGQVYYSHLRQSVGQIQTYKGIRPEIGYFTAFGKFALRLDWLSKRYEVDDLYTEKSHYHSQTLSWSNYFNNKTLLLNSSLRLAENSSEHWLNDYNSKTLSFSALYSLNPSWDMHLSASTSHFDFVYKPSVDVNKVSTTLSYKLATHWKSFITIEYNRVSQRYYPADINRSAYQIGLSRYF